MAETLADRIMAAADKFAAASKADLIGYRSGAGGNLSALYSARDHLAALVAEATTERVCRWRYRDVDGGVLWSDCGESDGGVWWSDCGESWCLEVGGLADNGVRFCQGCGGKVEEVAVGQGVTDGREVGNG